MNAGDCAPPQPVCGHAGTLQNGGAKLLAPLRAAQARLQEADAMLSGDSGADGATLKQVGMHARPSCSSALGNWQRWVRCRGSRRPAASERALPGRGTPAPDLHRLLIHPHCQALQTVRASSLNCYVYEALEDDSIETRASLFTQRFVSSADPCTFRCVPAAGPAQAVPP